MEQMGRTGGLALKAVAASRIRAHAWWCLALGVAGLASHWGEASRVPADLAYLDPGAGSFVIQALVATIAGVAVATRAYWTRIKAFFGRAPREEADAAAPSTRQGDDE